MGVNKANVNAAMKITQSLLAHPHLSTTNLRKMTGVNNNRFHALIKDMIEKGVIERKKEGSKYIHNISGWMKTFLAESLVVHNGVETYFENLLDTKLEKDGPNFTLQVPVPMPLAAFYLLKQLRRYLAPIIYLSILEMDTRITHEQIEYFKSYFGDENSRDSLKRVEILFSKAPMINMLPLQDIWTFLNGNYFTYFTRINPNIKLQIEKYEILKTKLELEEARKLFDFSVEKRNLTINLDQYTLQEPNDLLLRKKIDKKISYMGIIEYTKNYRSRKGAYIDLTRYNKECLAWTFILPDGSKEPTIFIKNEGLFISNEETYYYAEKRIKKQVNQVYKIVKQYIMNGNDKK